MVNLPAIVRQWIGWQTDQAISMDMSSASGETMKLVNAVNYHAQWTGGFRAEDNITDVFHLAGGQMCIRDRISSARQVW